MRERVRERVRISGESHYWDRLYATTRTFVITTNTRPLQTQTFNIISHQTGVLLLFYISNPNIFSYLYTNLEKGCRWNFMCERRGSGVTWMILNKKNTIFVRVLFLFTVSVGIYTLTLSLENGSMIFRLRNPKFLRRNWVRLRCML